MYRGRLQLATADAVYSDGDNYTPIITAYDAIGDKLSNVKNVLVLGAALGSAVQIMNKRGYTPDFVLIENDEQVIEWAEEWLFDYQGNIEMIKSDAEDYLHRNNRKFNLLIVDLFVGRVVPSFVTTQAFIENCRSHISEGGSFALNYIIQKGEEWEKFKEVFDTVFPQNKIVENGINRILVATV